MENDSVDAAFEGEEPSRRIPQEIIEEEDDASMVSSLPSILPVLALYPSAASVCSLPSVQPMELSAPDEPRDTGTQQQQQQAAHLEMVEEEDVVMAKILEARVRDALRTRSSGELGLQQERHSNEIRSTLSLRKDIPSTNPAEYGTDPFLPQESPTAKSVYPSKSSKNPKTPAKSNSNGPNSKIRAGNASSSEEPDALVAVGVDAATDGVPGAYAVASGLGNPPSEAEDEISESSEDPSEEPAFNAVLVVEDPQENDEEDGQQLQPPEPAPVPIIEEAKPLEDNTRSFRTKEICVLSVVVLLVVTAAMLTLGILGVFVRGNSADGKSIDGPTTINDTAVVEYDPFSSPTLRRIQREGVLRCVYQEPVGLFWTGLDNALCQAVAAAANAEVEYVPTVWINTLQDLRDGKIDVLANFVARTMDRGVHALRSNTGFAFTVPYLYGGFKVLGDPFFVDCAEQDFRHIEECKELSVCVPHNAVQEIKVKELVPPRSIVKIDGLLNLLQSVRNITALLESQACNVIVMEGTYLSDAFVSLQGYTGNFKTGTRVFSKDVAAVATRPDDPIFSDFVNTVIQTLLVAEAHNLTKDTADQAPPTDLFGPEYVDMFRNALRQQGSYAEIFKRNMGLFLSRAQLDHYHDSSPAEAVQSIPFGFVDNERDLEVNPFGWRLQEILDRGLLRCGIQVDRPGFAVATGEGHAGIEIDLCLGLAAALFQGNDQAVEFVEMSDSSNGYVLLAEGEVDVVAGVTWDLVHDVKEPTTGLGFAFTRPYFLDSGSGQENLSLATNQDDHDWLSFVFWYMNALRYAEENSITQQSSNEMPLVSLYGNQHQRMYRDAVLTVGSYAELYERNVQLYIPRDGRNAFNSTWGSTNGKPFVVPGLLEP